MAAFIHLQEYWRAYLLNLIFVCLLLTTHTLSYGDAYGEAYGNAYQSSIRTGSLENSAC